GQCGPRPRPARLEVTVAFSSLAVAAVLGVSVLRPQDPVPAPRTVPSPPPIQNPAARNPAAVQGGGQTGQSPTGQGAGGATQNPTPPAGAGEAGQGDAPQGRRGGRRGGGPRGGQGAGGQGPGGQGAGGQGAGGAPGQGQEGEPEEGAVRQAPPPRRGIAVDDALTQSYCVRCHERDAKGMMSRISYERKSPEGWEQSLKRMIRLYSLQITQADARQIVRYLADEHGLTRSEAERSLYE